LTGPVYDPTGAPLPNAAINFDSVRTQVIGGVSIGRVVKSVNTDASGNMGPNQFTQMLAMSITICDQYGNCGAPFSAIIPNTATAQFGNMIMGAFITQTIPPSSASGQVFGVNSGNTPEWETLSGGNGNCSFQWVSTGSYRLNCPLLATLASPTFTGTVTMPDTATWTSTGISSLTALGIGTAAPTGGTALAITRSFAGSALTTITNSNTATSALAGFQASNGTSNALFGETGTAATGNPPANSLYLTNNGAGGMYVSTTGGNYPIVFAPNGVTQATIAGSGLTLAQPLAIASGGRGSATAPTAGQIDVAQSATVFSAVTMSGDATLNATGAISVVKIGGITYGAAPTAGQMLIAQSATAYAPETMVGDITVSTAGAVNVLGLHFGASNAVTLPTSAPIPNSIAYFPNGTSLAASGALIANQPIIAGTAGSPPTSGTRSGNTTSFGTTAGTLIANDCVKFDSNGNLVDAGGQCGISGGPTFPNGSPPQITGYAAANTSEAETVSGDFTFARAGLNSYVATVTKISGTVPGGACGANAFVSSINSSAVPTCGPALTGVYAPLTNPTNGQNNYAPLASPTFSGTVTFPDSATHTATGLANLKGLSLLTTATATFPDLSTWTSTGIANSTNPVNISINGKQVGQFYAALILNVTPNIQQGGLILGGATKITGTYPSTDQLELGNGTTTTANTAGVAGSANMSLGVETPQHVAYSNWSPGLYNDGNGHWVQTGANWAHMATSKHELAVFLSSTGAAGTPMTNNYDQYLALRDTGDGYNQSLILTQGYFQTAAGNMQVGSWSQNSTIGLVINNTSGGTSANGNVHVVNDAGHNSWVGVTGSQYNASGAVLPSQPYQVPDSMQIFTDAGNGLFLTYPSNALFYGTVTGTWGATAPVFAVSSSADWGALINHMGNWPNNNTPTVSSCGSGTLAAGSRDTFGWIVNVGGSCILNFNHPFAGSQTVCTASDAGQPLLWYLANQTVNSVTFVCVVPQTGAACTGTQGWVEYHCAGMNG